jgi:ABC-type molybdenum transport system ATPase subunit/photorepair protein PhrA
LDVESRKLIESALHRYHHALEPQLVFTLRAQDHIPDYVSHIVQTSDDARGRRVSYIGPRSGWTPVPTATKPHQLPAQRLRDPTPLVELKSVNVSGRYPILRNLDWTIKEGERWHLKGPNGQSALSKRPISRRTPGSGKSTLLAMLTGDHPQSYQQDVTLFSTPRDKLATPTLQAQLGHVSPEIFNAFPRRYPGMNALEAVGTGYDTVYCYRELSDERVRAIEALAADFGVSIERLRTSFAELTGAEQSLMLLLRALIKKPKLLILDEPFAGMDEGLIERCKAYLDAKLDPRQALIIVTHFTEEIPASVDRLLELDASRVVQRL